MQLTYKDSCTNCNKKSKVTHPCLLGHKQWQAIVALNVTLGCKANAKFSNHIDTSDGWHQGAFEKLMPPLLQLLNLCHHFSAQKLDFHVNLGRKYRGRSKLRDDLMQMAKIDNAKDLWFDHKEV